MLPEEYYKKAQMLFTQLARTLAQETSNERSNVSEYTKKKRTG